MTANEYRVEIIWRNVIVAAIVHALGLYGFIAGTIGVCKWQTMIWDWLLCMYGSMGILAGAHRLWSHRAYKANVPLRVILAIAQTVALQNHIYHWCRNHRTHHKFADTDADPHNARRGFFFSHMGWLLCKKLPVVNESGKTVDMSDLLADPVVRFQRKHYPLLVLIFWAIIPIVVPMYFFGESFFVSFCGNWFRYIIGLHHSWSVNSIAHIVGYRPYDKFINPRENRAVTYLSLGEGYHNYHHVYPYDYSASELGWRDGYNPTTAVIDFFAWIGWVSERRVAGKRLVRQRSEVKGETDAQLNKINFVVELIFGVIAMAYPLIIIFAVRLILKAY